MHLFALFQLPLFVVSFLFIYSLEGHDADDPPLEGTARGTTPEGFLSEETGPSHVSASEGISAPQSEPTVRAQPLHDAASAPGMSFHFPFLVVVFFLFVGRI